MKTWEANKCMLDDFSAAHIVKYKAAGFDDPEAKIVLQQMAQSMRMDIADMESRHASLRRMLKSVVQTHMLNKANMSAQVVGRSLAKRQQRAGGSRCGLSSGNKTEEERGIQHKKKWGCEISVGHFLSASSLRGEED